MIDKLTAWFDKVQDLLDLNGDIWMALFTAFILWRIAAVIWHHAPLTASEAGTYSSAVMAFAYSNKGKPKV
jgi:hypothetical protein